ncbi:asparagine synthase-related protein [Isoptericola sp. NPDC056573]|uniref:asparagine synthase-related protein n=1 Tax=Isoptericola sp. NPDC056573 TaxID=3345868 RepID=UPI0036B9C498
MRTTAGDATQDAEHDAVPVHREPGDGLERLGPVEVAVGMPLGPGRRDAAPEPAAAHGRGGARAVLESLVADALRAGPAVVSFSGGRDSSAVLAVAAHVARRDGLPLPVPVTLVYPGLHEADESSWQHAVLDHLDLADRLVTVPVTDEERLLGARARSSLARHGLVWPAAAHANLLVESLGSGTRLLSGEGGDEVLGARRVTPWTVARAHGRPQGLRHLRELAGTIGGPALPLGPLASHNPWIGVPPWLRPPARAALRRHVAGMTRTPWRYDRATAAMTGQRVPQVLARNVQALAADRGVRWHHPLQHPRFVRALAHDGGSWGFRGRTDTMRFLFADLLPDAVLSRRSKASFNGSRFGDDERDFAAGWDGSGVDDGLVDVRLLRDLWLGERPPGVTGLLLHQAWLARGEPR